MTLLATRSKEISVVLKFLRIFSWRQGVQKQKKLGKHVKINGRVMTNFFLVIAGMLTIQFAFCW